MSDTRSPVTALDSQYENLAARFRPIFDRIGNDALQRETSETLAHEQIGWLRDAGFARLRLPTDLGGLGARISDVFLLIAELATVDPNLAHIWRNHFSFIEDRVHSARDDFTDKWFTRLGNAEIIGGGWSEPDTPANGVAATTVTPTEGGWFVNGVKAYSTGSNYSTWNNVLAVDPDGQPVVAFVAADQPGVNNPNDWSGFGQRITGSGSVTYRDAFVEHDDVVPYTTRYLYQGQFYQTFLNAILVGITRAVRNEGIAALRARHRAHRANVVPDDATHDPQLLEVIGRISAHAYAVDSTLYTSARSIDPLADVANTLDQSAHDEKWLESWIAVGQAQLAISEHVLEAASTVFDALGASGASRSLSLDRHWRNARTLISHNPRVAKARKVAEWLVNGDVPAPLPELISTTSSTAE